jgi:hypothetical protein
MSIFATGAKRNLMQDGLVMGDMGIIAAPDQPQTDMQPQAQPKTNLWGKVANVVGTLSDGVLAAYGQQGAYTQQKQMQQKFDQQQALAFAKAAMDRQNAQARIDYERANPAPTAVMQNYGFLKTINPAMADSYASSLGDRNVTMALPGGGFYTGPQSGMAGTFEAGQGKPPTAPVGELRPYTGDAAPITKPTVISPAQYRANRASMGDAKVNAWMAQNNIIVGGR